MSVLSRILSVGLTAISFQATAADTVKIAVIDPLSGPFANVGEAMVRHMQLAIDMVVLVIAFGVTTPTVVAWSVLGAVVLNLFVAINHRADRYIAL